MTVFKKVKKTQQTFISQYTVQPYFCCNIHNGRDALNYFGSRQVTEFSQQLAILNPARSDFKYLSDFGFLKKWRISSDLDADAESVTSLIRTAHFYIKMHQIPHQSHDFRWQSDIRLSWFCIFIKLPFLCNYFWKPKQVSFAKFWWKSNQIFYRRCTPVKCCCQILEYRNVISILCFHILFLNIRCL